MLDSLLNQIHGSTVIISYKHMKVVQEYRPLMETVTVAASFGLKLMLKCCLFEETMFF